MKEKIYLEEVYDLSEELKDYEIINFSISFDKEVCLLALYNNNYYSALNTYKIIIINHNFSIKIILENIKSFFHYIEKLPNEEILLVNARSNYYGRDEYKKNAKVYDYNVNFKREFHLGDSIQNISANKTSEIWVSYFDESISWRYDNLDSAGVACFDKEGNITYLYNDNFILDCYAMNLVSNNELWFYYYNDFNLICLNNKKEVKSYKFPLKGFNNFSIWKNYVLTSGGYEESYFHLFDLSKAKNIEEKVLIEFFNKDDIYLNNKIVFSKSELTYFFYNNKLYQFNLRKFL